MDSSGSQVDLPGFRFHPTEEELLDFYLSTVVNGKRLQFDVITTVNIYRYDPWELPGLARIGEREWYFYVPRDRKQSNGGRPNRTTGKGFWKATGSDRPIRSAADPKRLIGLKKTLVYYEGRAPRGTRTDWVMNEYRLPDGITPPKEDIVLCKIYRKATSLKELEHRAAMLEEARSSQTSGSPVDSLSCSDQESFQKLTALEKTGNRVNAVLAKEEEEQEQDVVKIEVEAMTTATVDVQSRPMSLTELEVPKYSGLEWMQDPFLTQLRSPWMEQWSPYYTSVLNI
ncbi:NAC domain-containing protein 6-like [Typha latifolia]|uniref:NAC domain-containing protein 6-like n=1 Tax=Typha latifolia TaxID=4733 RepID=UPI003C2B7D76